MKDSLKIHNIDESYRSYKEIIHGDIQLNTRCAGPLTSPALPHGSRKRAM